MRELLLDLSGSALLAAYLGLSLIRAATLPPRPRKEIRRG